MKKFEVFLLIPVFFTAIPVNASQVSVTLNDQTFTIKRDGNQNEVNVSAELKSGHFLYLDSTIYDSQGSRIGQYPYAQANAINEKAVVSGTVEVDGNSPVVWINTSTHTEIQCNGTNKPV